MAWTKTRTSIVVGTVVLLALGAATAAFFLLNIPHQITLAGGRRTIANHIAEPVNLTTPYTTPASYFDKITAFPAWTAVPRGFQVFANVPLQIDGMICLWGSGNAAMGLIFPEQITGIEMKRKFETLYIYHASFFASPNGTPVYEVVFRYDDGSSATNQICYGTDVLDWYANRGNKVIGPTGPNAKLAWHGVYSGSGNTQPLRFCLTAVNNPHPAVEVASIDLFSCKSRTAGCIHAFTTGRSGLLK
jgi:hypothetical protein